MKDYKRNFENGYNIVKFRYGQNMIIYIDKVLRRNL